MAPPKGGPKEPGFSEGFFQFKDFDRKLYGWEKWVSRSHPTDEVDIEDRHLRKTIQRLEKQSRESAARHVAKSTLLPWQQLMGVWRDDRDHVERKRQPAPLQDVSHVPQANGARQPHVHKVRDMQRLFPTRVGGGIPDGEDAAWLTARMAARLHTVATALADMADKEECHVLSNRLPHFARPFLYDAEHPGWRAKFGRCLRHIANELAEGQPPNPDSTGEHMAMHVTIGVAEEWHSFGYFEARGIDQELPAHPNDSDWPQARECGYAEADIAVLFQLGVADPHMIELILPDSSHLHPSQWFLDKRPEDTAQQPMSVLRKMPRAVKVAPPTIKQGSVDKRSSSASVLVVPDQRTARVKEKMKERLESEQLPCKMTYSKRDRLRAAKPVVAR